MTDLLFRSNTQKNQLVIKNLNVSQRMLLRFICLVHKSYFPQKKVEKQSLIKNTNKTKENATVDGLDYQIPVTHLTKERHLSLILIGCILDFNNVKSECKTFLYEYTITL